MKHTNININSPYGMMQYFFEYQNNADFVSGTPEYIASDNICFYKDGISMLVRNGNEWTPVSEKKDGSWVLKEDVRKQLIEVRAEESVMSSYNISSINVYFPRFSVETYQKHVKYALDISTYIHGYKVSLGSYLIDRNDVLACDGIKKFVNQEYYEYLNVQIIDPWYMIYDENWKVFRETICGEQTIEEDGSQYELNNTGSVIHITLHPVTLREDGVYREMDDYWGGQNAINLSDTVEDYLHFDISDNRDSVSVYDENLEFKTSIVFNNTYEQNTDGLKEYLKETYLLDTYKMYVEVVIQDDLNIYKHILEEVTSPWQVISRDELAFDSWDGWKEGMYINAFLHLYTTTPDELNKEDAFIYLQSNRILLTQELFRYLANPIKLQKVYLDFVDMKTYNINAVNKIQQNIIQIDRPDSYKTNIIKPVFFRSRELANLVLHPAVTENICLNLDQYKSKVDTFIIKIEGTSFIEYGRTANGVIFKIVGSNLANEQATGTYYILNQDSELVTSGKYTYES